MANANITSEKWVLDADLEGQKEEQVRKKKGWPSTFALAYSAVGVVYGDVGTSPLYVFSSTFTTDTPTETDVLGAMSIIFWTITLIVVVKYMLIVLLADDNGEGGTFALYSLICRFAGMRPATNGIPDASDVTLSRYSRHTGDKNIKSLSSRISFQLKQYLATTAGAQASLLCLVLLMTSMVLGDGVLTPAQSVLGAIYGLQVKTSVSQGAIVGISCGIVILLFMVQRFGTGRVGFFFAPIVLIYFLCNLIIAITNISRYKPDIFKALSPHYAYYYFRDNRHLGWVQCSGLFLAITGTEATYADLGHFSRPAIRISFLVICYPVLIVTYLGQAAWLTRYPDQVSSTFYASIPYGDGFYWFVFVFATGAACVASQAMISAAFSIVKQSIALGCFPQLSVQHVSDKVLGSVYIPEVNYVMMVLTVAVIAIFKTTVQLGNAYGVAVSSMMFGTTVLIYMVMLMIWETNFFLATAFLISFGFIDMVFTTANLNKVPHGGWFALAIAGAVFSLSYLWWWGTNIKHQRMLATQMKMQDLLGTNLIYNKSKKDDASSPDDSVDESLTGPGPCSNSPIAEDDNGISSPKLVTGNGAAPANGPHDQLVLASTGQPLLRIPAVGIMFADTLYGAPTILPELVNRWGVVHKVLIILTIRQVAVSTVSESERLLFRKLRYPGIYRCVARYGYRDRVHMDNKFVIKLLDKVNEVDPSVAHVVQQANMVNTSYIVSFIKLFVKQDIVGIKGAFRRFFLQDVYSNMGLQGEALSDAKKHNCGGLVWHDESCGFCCAFVTCWLNFMRINAFNAPHWQITHGALGLSPGTAQLGTEARIPPCPTLPGLCRKKSARCRSVRTRRFQSLSTQDLCQFLIVGVLSGLFWLQRAKSSTTAAASDTLGLLFFELLFLSFRQLFVALFTFPDEFKMLLKERASGMYRLSAFYFARTASDLPMDMAIPTLFLLLVYFMGHLRYTAAAFFANFFTVILVMLVAQSYGLLLGTIVMVPKTAQTLAAIIMLTFILTGGYFVRGIPVWISWFKYLSFIFYGYGQLVHIEFKDRNLYTCTDPNAAGSAAASIDVSNPQTDPRCVLVTNVQSALGLQQGVNSKTWKIINPCILIFTLVLLRVLVYVALRRKTSRV